MERERNKQASPFITILVAALLSQNLLIPVIATSVEDQKNYYSPDPHAGRPPSGSHRTPPSGTSPRHGGTTPSHGSYNPTPSHGSYNPTPSTGGGGSYGTPTHDPTPSTPTGGGGGGYYHSPPTTGGGVGGSPPLVLSPPTTPISIDPGTPGISIPTPPFLPDPNSPFTGTCNLQQALSNTRTDGLGELYREGTASLLNSMVNKRFPFTTKQVRDRFAAALSSNKAAAAQAHLFKLANEGKLKPRA
ncbi:Protodermal factor 1 [Vitis vinifera]|uniref:Protodermal factor 1 n=1 Tax=Vitis vinifera TaxID=29760 RepID=A0A438DW59_VITVI|nr:Protodermal factor 1 [Vitis vinifera]